MKCPYCKREMTSGTLSGNGNTMLKFSPQNAPRSFFGSGKVIRNAKYNYSRFEIKADYCDSCNKMIFDARM